MARNQKAVGLDLQRKTLYLTKKQDELLREEAYQNRTTESEIVRAALSLYYSSQIDPEKVSAASSPEKATSSGGS